MHRVLPLTIRDSLLGRHEFFEIGVFIMNKSQLIKAVAEKSGLSQKQVAEVWNSIEETMIETLVAGDKIQLSGFGTFEVRERAERAGRNPKTGEVVTVPACTYPAYVAAKAVKEKLN